MSEDSNKPPDVPTTSSTWKLPDGIEDHLESGTCFAADEGRLSPLMIISQLMCIGLIKTAIGVAVGGLAGMVLFRSGGGWRSASAAMGVGVALGSTYERMAGPKSS